MWNETEESLLLEQIFGWEKGAEKGRQTARDGEVHKHRKGQQREESDRQSEAKGWTGTPTGVNSKFRLKSLRYFAVHFFSKGCDIASDYTKVLVLPSVYNHTHTQTRARTHTYTYIHARTHTHAYSHTHAYIQTSEDIHSHLQVDTHLKRLLCVLCILGPFPAFCALLTTRPDFRSGSEKRGPLRLVPRPADNDGAWTVRRQSYFHPISSVTNCV